MGSLKVFTGLVVGFAGATALVAGIDIGLGGVDPAVAGGIHIVTWGCLSWLFWSTLHYRNAPPQSHGRKVFVPANPSDPSRRTPPPVQPTEEDAQPTKEEPQVDEPLGRRPRRRRARVGAAVLVALVVVGLAATAGFAVAKNGVPETTTTTTSTTVPVLSGLDDLTDNEKVWCWRDRETGFRWFAAAQALGFWDFKTNLHDFRDGKSGTLEPMSADLENWEDDAGEDWDRQVAVACRAAYETR